MKNQTRTFSRIVSLCLILAMLLTLLPTISVFPLVKATAAQTVDVYFKNVDGWSTVYGYVWDGDGNPQMGSWPGTKLDYDGTTGCYHLSCEYTSGGDFNVIFNDNGYNQTGDLTISAADLLTNRQWWVNGKYSAPTAMSMPVVEDGKATFTYHNASASVVVLSGTMNDWGTMEMDSDGKGNFTYTYELKPGMYTYKLIVDGEWINDPANPYTYGDDNNNVCVVPGIHVNTITVGKGVATELPTVLDYTDESGTTTSQVVSYALTGTYSTYGKLDGNSLTISPAYTGTTFEVKVSTSNGATAILPIQVSETAPTACTVTLHFLNTLGWEHVCAYAWSETELSTFGNWTWPGKVIDRDENGLYTLELTVTPVAGEDLLVIFHNNNGTQTVDLSIDYDWIVAQRELYFQPDTYTNDDGKYAGTMTFDSSELFYSPVVDGSKVTFRYRPANGQTAPKEVYLAGSFNDWSTSATEMTKTGSNEWSVTLDLKPGAYEYKFVVDGEWILDATNGLTGGYDGNNIALVPDTEEVPENEVKVVFHFYRENGDYDGWDLWYWGSDGEGHSTEFTEDPTNKGVIATFYVDGVYGTTAGYVVRKSDWSDKEFYDRTISISDVVSGTVHFFLQSGSSDGCRVLGLDVVSGAKITDASFGYDTGKIYPNISLPVSGGVADAFTIYDSTGADKDVAITSVELSNGQYVLSLNKTLDVGKISNYRVTFRNTTGNLWINTHDLFYSSSFNSDYNYTGDDLGATWSKESTTFKVWAPTAKNVQILRYAGGNYGTDDWIETVDMTLGDQGVWSATVSGDLNGTYYNYLVHFDGYTTEATDPYARATGANGDRGMVIDLDSTDPVGWENDVSPNAGMSYTDAILYEMHVREFTIDSSSGVKDEWRGTYLGLTQTGTNYDGYSTVLEHLKELGVTHVQLMPVYDYNSVDEYHLTDWQQYAWGYDPKNYNVPEGSYSTDPFHGEVRVNEFKQMVQSFHRNGINVVMDVAYNHAFDGGNFCYNKIVPNYFCRFYGEGNWSNGSGVGNDIATERVMTRNYIVDSILYWVEEYHIDGFRFDLAGLIDTQTINEIVNTVHAKYPNVIFYGEGWAPGGTAVEYGYDLTTQGNAWQVGGFSFFNDTFRNAIAGDNGSTWGFASGSWDYADTIANCFRASNGWSTTPTQTINYISCHDNYSLIDKIILSKGGTDWFDMVKMNNLAAAVNIMAQGTPFIYSGEELLREKKDGDGNRHDNAYGTDDYVNKIRWSDLKDKQYAQMTDDYYCGLIDFRRNHAALRNSNGSDAWNAVSYYKISDQVILFYIDGFYNYEVSDGICIIYNASTSSQYVNLGNYIPSGYWQACVHGTQAGNTALWGLDVGSGYGEVGVDALSTTILVKGALYDVNSVYNQNLAAVSCSHENHNTDGVCTKCGADVGHNYVNDICTVCGGERPLEMPTIQPVGASLAFKDEVYYNVHFTISNPDNISIAEKGLLTWTGNRDASIEDADYVLPGATQESNNQWKVRSQAIAAKNLGEDLHMMVYLKLSDGTYVYSNVLNYSAKTYATNKLADSGTDANTKALCVALLNYGAAAQEYFGYKTDDLMNADLTKAQQALVKSYSADMVPALGSVGAKGDGLKANGGFADLGASVNFGGALGINYLLDPTNSVDDQVKLYVWSQSDVDKLSELTLSNASQVVTMERNGWLYAGEVVDISARNAGETVYVCAVYESNGVTYRTGVIAYSVAAYCKNIAAQSGEFQNVAKAAAVYAYYADLCLNGDK